MERKLAANGEQALGEGVFGQHKILPGHQGSHVAAERLAQQPLTVQKAAAGHAATSAQVERAEVLGELADGMSIRFKHSVSCTKASSTSHRLWWRWKLPWTMGSGW